MKSDIEIAQETPLKDIGEIAAMLGIGEEHISRYGKYKAKADLSLLDDEGKEGKLILVTAITPTPAGEGKTTTTIGLADGLRRIGKKSVVALREPSLGPVFGVKGGATGGGYAQVGPFEEINLHFTGDFHAIGAANNLLCAMLDNHIYQGNALGIDPRRVVIRRCVDMNDRQLRSVVDGLGGKVNGVPREDGYDITVATEMMAVMCMATSYKDLKERCARMIVGYTYDDKPFTVNAVQMGQINENVFNYFGTSAGIIQNKYTEDEWNAYYEGKIEPFALQLSLVMSNMTFTPREIAHGNAIVFTANRLQYASNQTKLNISTQLFDRGLLNRNGVMDIWNMAHVEGGEKYYIRKEYTEISQLGKEANTNASNEGSGISVDGASVDGGGEEGNEEV